MQDPNAMNTHVDPTADNTPWEAKFPSIFPKNRSRRQPCKDADCTCRRNGPRKAVISGYAGSATASKIEGEARQELARQTYEQMQNADSRRTGGELSGMRNHPFCSPIRSLFFALLLCAVLVGTALSLFAAETNAPKVHAVRIQAPITPVVAEFVAYSLKKAQEVKAEAIVLELDTPRRTGHCNACHCEGYACQHRPRHCLCLAERCSGSFCRGYHHPCRACGCHGTRTNIGAAHPVGVGQKMDEVMSAKATNDAAAYVRSIAEQHGRNAQWAEDAVRKSISSTETEALKAGIIDLIAKDIPDLLASQTGKPFASVNAAIPSGPPVPWSLPKKWASATNCSVLSATRR